MVGADAGGDRELELRRSGDPVGGEIGRPEGLRDDDVEIGQLALEYGIGPVLVGGDDELVPLGLEPGAKAEPPETLPSNSPGVKSIARGVGRVCPSG